jgi:hypothetical protein
MALIAKKVEVHCAFWDCGFEFRLGRGCLSWALFVAAGLCDGQFSCPESRAECECVTVCDSAHTVVRKKEGRLRMRERKLIRVDIKKLS